MIWERISVGDQERVLVARNHQLKTILTPGRYTIFTPPFVPVELEKHNVSDLGLRRRWAGDLLERRAALAGGHFVGIATNELQVAMVYVNEQLFKVLTPFSRILIWRDVAEI